MSFHFGTMADIKYNFKDNSILKVGVIYTIIRFTRRKGPIHSYYSCRLIREDTQEEFGTRFNMYQATELGLFKARDDNSCIMFKLLDKKQTEKGYTNLTFGLL